MSKFGIDTGIAGKAMRAVGKTGTPDGLPAWVFENQSGDLGTNLNGSLIWCGVAGSLSVIPTGITLGSVLTLSIKSGGSNYINGTTDTTCSNNMAQDLTVAITQTGGAITGATVAAAGSGYNVGDIITPTQSGAGQTGGEFVITSVKSGVPIAAQSIEFKVQAGQYLPIAVDYITNLANPMTDADIVICK
jgi:hypothetical protein